MSNFSTWKQLENFHKKNEYLKGCKRNVDCSKQLWKQKIKHTVSTALSRLDSCKGNFHAIAVRLTIFPLKMKYPIS